MKNRFLITLTVVLALFAFGCGTLGFIGQKEKDKADIKAALEKYLNERAGLNMSAMNWEIKEFSQDRDRATVKVMFSSKQGGAQMPVTYELKKENGVWAVQRPSGGGASPHGAAAPGAMPGGVMPPPQLPASGELPASHPPVSKEPAKPAAPPKKP